MKMHARSVRLFVNAGMDFPVCKANAKLLDIECRYPTTSFVSEITCKHCLNKLKKEGHMKKN